MVDWPTNVKINFALSSQLFLTDLINKLNEMKFSKIVLILYQILLLPRYGLRISILARGFTWSIEN